MSQIGNITEEKISQILEEMLGGIEIEVNQDQLRGTVKRYLDKELPNVRDSLAAEIAKVRPVEITIKSGKVVEKEVVEGPVHKQFEELFMWLTTETGTGIYQPVWCYGNPGCGKTHVSEQEAEALHKFAKKAGWKPSKEIGDVFYFPIYFGPTTTEGKVLGYKNAATGDFVKGLAQDAYEHGGLLYLDEIDVADPSVLVSVNSLLANKSYRFPDGKIRKRNKFFFVLAGANTLGTGSKDGFKRNVQDAASRDRFAKVYFDLDEDLEKSLAGHVEWVQYVQKVRGFIQTLAKGAIHVTPRASYGGAAALKRGIPAPAVLRAFLFNEMTDDVKASVVSHCGPFPSEND